MEGRPLGAAALPSLSFLDFPLDCLQLEELLLVCLKALKHLAGGKKSPLDSSISVDGLEVGDPGLGIFTAG